MPAYIAAPVSMLLDASGNAVGVLGIDGREYLFPASLSGSSEAGAILASTEFLFDPVTKAPVGILSSDGREYVFGSSFTLNITGGLRIGQRGTLVSASTGQPLGVRGGANALFVTPPTLNGAPPAVAGRLFDTKRISGNAVFA